MTEQEWRKAYTARLVERGLSQSEAEECCLAVDSIDCKNDPEDSADDELSYWAQD